jgi:hypothetical protein
MVDVDEINAVVVVGGSSTDVVAAWSAEHAANTKSAIHRRIRSPYFPGPANGRLAC